MSKSDNPFRCFNSSPAAIRLVVMMYVRFPLSLRNVEDLLFERGIDICHETVRFLVEQVWPDFHWRDSSQAGVGDALVRSVALAFG